MLGWDPYGFLKKHVRIRYAERVFLHPVGSTVHVVHFGASGARNIGEQFFMFWWDQFRFNEKRAGTHYTELGFLHPVVSAGHVVHFVAPFVQNIDTLFLSSCGTGTESTKSGSGHVTLYLCFCLRGDLWVT
jgi:hypothetical protein